MVHGFFSMHAFGSVSYNYGGSALQPSSAVILHEIIVALLWPEKLVVFVSQENSDILRCLSR